MSLFRRRSNKPAVPKPSEEDRAELFRAAREGVLVNGLWSLVEASVQDQILSFRGFAIPPRDLPVSRRFFVDGVETPSIALDRSLGHLVARFKLRTANEDYTFHCQHPLVDRTANTAKIEFRAGTGRTTSSHQDWIVPLSRAGGVLPEARRRARVAGTSDPLLFEAVGMSCVAMMGRVLKDYFAREYWHFTSILDWGCGCGRVARYASGAAPGKIVGVDIDRDNIRWCAENIAAATFRSIQQQPPTGFPNGTFDLIYGISVFTHLSESDQNLWLAELRRIALPGAAVLMSIHGETAFLRADGSAKRFLTLQREGMLDYGRCEDLDEVLPEQKAIGSYRNVLHSRRYIYDKWSAHFEILDVLEGAVGGHQDLVIMKARPE